MEESGTYRLLVYVGRPLWGFRVELGILLVLLVVWLWLASHMPGEWVSLLLGVGTAGLLAIKHVRQRFVWLLHRQSVCRQWERAARHAGLATLNDRVPSVAKVRRTPAGDVLRVAVPLGSKVGDLEDAAEVVAAAMEARDVRVERDPANARYASVSVVRRDPLADTDPDRWPWADKGRLSVWDPVPVGIGEDGEPLTVRLPERNVLLGGEPGAGKSVAQSLLVATAALDPEADLVLLDGKQVELAPWSRCATATVGPDVREATKVLDALRTEMDARYAVLLGERRRKVERNDGLRPTLVVVDELAFYLSVGDRKDCRAFAQSLRDLVSRGRAAGMIVVAATQKPSHEIVPTAVRDLFAFRWALRCTTPQASDTILGSGWASLGFNAATVDAANRGDGYLLAEGGEPARCRSYLLDDKAVERLAAKAERVRGISTEQVASTPAGMA